MDPGILASAFFLVALSELGDKSFLAIVALASWQDRRAVFLGAASALALMALLASALGSLLAGLLPQAAVLGAASALFLAFGVWILRGSGGDGGEATLSGRGAFAGSFLLLLMMEMGDKTQVSILTLAAAAHWPSVLLGAVAAFLVLTAAATLLGDSLGRRLSPERVAQASGVLFLAFGLAYAAAFLMEALS